MSPLPDRKTRPLRPPFQAQQHLGRRHVADHPFLDTHRWKRPLYHHPIPATPILSVREGRDITASVQILPIIQAYPAFARSSDRTRRGKRVTLHYGRGWYLPPLSILGLDCITGPGLYQPNAITYKYYIFRS